MENGKEIIRHTSQIKCRKGEHPKFIENTVMMLSSNTMPYYAELNTFVNFMESENVPTCGVNIGREGMNFFWNRKFVDSLTLQEALFLLLHEDFHLLFDHSKRSIIYNKEFSNIAQDMIINQIIFDEVMSHEKCKGKVEIPKNHNEFIMGKDGNPLKGKDGNPIKNPLYNHNSGLFIPTDYPGEHIFENLYEWMKDKQDDYKKRLAQFKQQQGEQGDQNDQIQSGSGQDSDGNGQESKTKGKGKDKGKGKGKPDPNSQDQGNGQSDPQDQGDGQGDDQIDNESGASDLDSFGKPRYGKNGQNGVECVSLDSIFDSIERGEQLTLDNHIDDDVPEDARKSIVNDFMQRLKNRGLVSGEVEKMLNKLRKTKHDYLKEIKRTISHHVFGHTKVKSITRPNRRGIEGIKGKKKHKNVINTILDTSGSMNGDFEGVLSYIFQNDIHINLIQIDTVVKAVENITCKKDLEKMTIKGLGGTTLQPAIDYISNPKHKLNVFSTVMLTDGQCDHLNFSQINKKVLILTTSTEPHIDDPKGLVKCIVIDVKNSLHGS
jgi:predicted metal-dependent peptidase